MYTSRADLLKVLSVLERVGSPASTRTGTHMFSGGQRQHHRAIIANPELIIADEPISALDVSIRRRSSTS